MGRSLDKQSILNGKLVQKFAYCFLLLLLLLNFSKAVIGVDDAAMAFYGICQAYTGNCIGTILQFGAGFSFDVTPTSFNLPNCGNGQDLQATVRNPFLLSSVNVYANKVPICKIPNNILGGTTQTCSLTVPAKKAGASGTETISLVMDAVGENGSQDAGKGNSKMFSLAITHVQTAEEQNSKSRVDSAKDAYQSALNKINTYGLKIPMSRANSALSGVDSMLSQAEAQFTECGFTNANSIAGQALSKSQQAYNQAEVDYQDGKAALTEIDMARSSIDQANSKVNLYQSQGIEVSNALGRKTEADSLLSQAQSYFSNADFGTAREYARRAENKASEATSLAELDAQNAASRATTTQAVGTTSSGSQGQNQDNLWFYAVVVIAFIAGGGLLLRSGWLRIGKGK